METPQEIANRVVANCDDWDAGLRDEDPEVVEVVRGVITELVRTSAPHQLRAFLLVVSTRATMIAKGGE